MPIPSEVGNTSVTPKIYTSTKAGGVQTFTAPSASTGQQAATPALQTIAAAGITVPVRQVLGEWIETGNLASVNSGAPVAGQEGAGTVVKVAAQVTSTGNEQNNNTTNPYLVAPWSTKSVV